MHYVLINILVMTDVPGTCFDCVYLYKGKIICSKRRMHKPLLSMTLTVDDEHSPTIFLVYYDDREYLITS